jgi:Tfp pilus assembly protein PilF
LAFNLAVSLDRLGQKKSAAQYYQRALQLDPQLSAGFDHKQISQHIEDLTH